MAMYVDDIYSSNGDVLSVLFDGKLMKNKKLKLLLKAVDSVIESWQYIPENDVAAESVSVPTDEIDNLEKKYMDYMMSNLKNQSIIL